VLYLYAHIDEFVMQHLVGVAGKTLISVEAANLEAGDGADSKEDNAKKEDSTTVALDEATASELCKWFSDDALGGKLKEVKVSNRLVSSPALISGHEPEAMRRYRMVQTDGERCRGEQEIGRNVERLFDDDARVKSQARNDSPRQRRAQEFR
jgi:TNF receptor-associated protein 1